MLIRAPYFRIQGMTSLSRRDFLKLAGATTLGMAASRLQAIPNAFNGQPNFLIIVYDAFSGLHLSTNGYPRETTPNLNRLLDRAIVYHNHYSGGNYTTPGTASLFTGTLPWTHQAITHNDTVAKAFVQRNIFHSFPEYHRMAYSHNIQVNTQLRQFRGDIEDYDPRNMLFVGGNSILSRLLAADDDIVNVAWNRALKQQEEGYSYSLVLSQITEKLKARKIESLLEDYPLGLPNQNFDDYFILDKATDYLMDQISTAKAPFLGYYHLLPPHAPYNPHGDFVDRFKNDHNQMLEDTLHPFFGKDRSLYTLNKNKNHYDEFILNVDREFARLFDYLERRGVLDNTWVILTSDHGELFERGIMGHLTPAMYQAVIRIPLIIFEPGRVKRLDITQNTSGTDIHPTLLSIAGKPIPDWIEGQVLPPFNPANLNSEREVFALQAKGIGKTDPIHKASVMLVKGNHKIVYYFGYKEIPDKGDHIEVYDLENDPSEKNDLRVSKPGLTSDLLALVKDKLTEVNRPYL